MEDGEVERRRKHGPQSLELLALILLNLDLQPPGEVEGEGEGEGKRKWGGRKEEKRGGGKGRDWVPHIQRQPQPTAEEMKD